MGRKAYYGVIGNGETVTLIHPDLSIDWLCIPRIDGFPLFARALDPDRGGSFSLKLDQPLQPVKQTYIGRTNVLKTTAKSGSLLIESVDFMPWQKPLIIRDITVINHDTAGKPVQPRIEASPTDTVMHQYQMWSDDKTGISYIADDYGVLAYRVEGVIGYLDPGEEGNLRIVLAYGKSPNEIEQILDEAEDHVPQETIFFWENWLRQGKKITFPDPDWEEAYYRSLLVLKLLCYEETGAMIAAATASFPAVPYGSDNWDYRFVWLRDGYYAALSLDAGGFHAEPRRFYEFIFSLQAEDGSWPQPLYSVDGSAPQEQLISDMKGPRGETPIRIGNLAASQLQLDNNGNILHGIWYHYQQTGDRSFLEKYWPQIIKAVQWVERNWNRPENGMWEIRERQDHWIHGKVMCCVCLKVGAKIAETLGDSASAASWRKSAASIHRDILDKSWNATRQVILQSYSEDAPMDISVLALAFYGVMDANHDMLRKTVKAMEQPLIRPQQVAGAIQGHITADPFAGMEKGGLYMWGGIARYDYAHLPFYLPTLWLARYYLMTGKQADRERARELIQICLDCATDLYLMAEHFDPRTGEQWGNFPQSFSHEELIRILIEWQTGPIVDPVEEEIR